MSLDYALLGFLKKSSKTGYELQKKISNTINHFWSSTQSQIYRTLTRMEKDGLIHSEIYYQDDKPNKKIYTITPEGEKELVNWLETPLNIPNHRNPFLVQLFFSGDTDYETIKSNLLHYQNEMKTRLAFLGSKEAQQMVFTGNNKKEQFIYQALINNGKYLLISEIDWVDECLQQIDNVEEP